MVGYLQLQVEGKSNSIEVFLQDEILFAISIHHTLQALLGGTVTASFRRWQLSSLEPHPLQIGEVLLAPQGINELPNGRMGGTNQHRERTMPPLD